MREFIVRVVVHLVCFVLAMIALQALNYEKLLRRGKVVQAQVLYVLCAMALGLLAAQFLLNLAYRL